MEVIFLYVMTNPEWVGKYKYGVTKNLTQRIYNSYEQHSKRTQYLHIFQIEKTPKAKIYSDYDKVFSMMCRDIEQLNIIEDYYQVSLPGLKEIFDRKYLIEEGGGTEFISEVGLPTLLNAIHYDFPKLGLQIKKEYNEEELRKENEKVRLKIEKKVTKKKEEWKKLFPQKTENLFQEKNEFTPYDYQQKVLDTIIDFYKSNNIGKLIWACGLGKALFSMFIALRLNCKSILVGVPSRNLVCQFIKEAKRLFHDSCILGICSADDMTTNRKEIEEFIVSKKNKIIITTYHSCHIVKNICDNFKITFDLKIGDECHHLVGKKYKSERENTEEEERIARFKQFHFIPSNKSLFMTATQKYIDDYKDKEGISMDNEVYFGKEIDNKSVNWAIENKKITDYNVCIYRNTEQQIDTILNTLGIEVENKELFLSAYMSLKVLEEQENLTHLLVYANKTCHADLVYQYIYQILEKGIISLDLEDLYCQSLHSNMKNKVEHDHKLSFDIPTEVEKFKASKWGIICCVQIFGEGFDLPKLNGVVISENMDSEIRIVQSCLRPHRREKGNPEKEAFILCPFIDKKDYRNILKNESFQKIKQILFHLRNNDSSVLQRMKLYDFKPSFTRRRPEDKIAELVRNEDHLEIFKIRCRSAISLGNDTQELDEYEFVRKINQELGLLRMNDYYERQMEHSYFVEDPEQYFSRMGVWLHWYDFLNIETSVFLPNKEEWKKRCRELGIKTLDQYQIKNKEYPELPENPGDFYPDFSNIPYELNPSGGRRRR